MFDSEARFGDGIEEVREGPVKIDRSVVFVGERADIGVGLDDLELARIIAPRSLKRMDFVEDVTTADPKNALDLAEDRNEVLDPDVEPVRAADQIE